MAVGYWWLRDRGVWLSGLATELAGLGPGDICRKDRLVGKSRSLVLNV